MLMCLDMGAEATLVSFMFWPEQIHNICNPKCLPLYQLKLSTVHCYSSQKKTTTFEQKLKCCNTKLSTKTIFFIQLSWNICIFSVQIECIVLSNYGMAVFFFFQTQYILLCSSWLQGKWCCSICFHTAVPSSPACLFLLAIPSSTSVWHQFRRRLWML